MVNNLQKLFIYLFIFCLFLIDVLLVIPWQIDSTTVLILSNQFYYVNLHVHMLALLLQLIC